MVLLAPKLSNSVLNNQLLKHFAKCQLDEQPSIRTNVNICLGKIAQHLSPAVSPLLYSIYSCSVFLGRLKKKWLAWAPIRILIGVWGGVGS